MATQPCRRAPYITCIHNDPSRRPSRASTEITFTAGAGSSGLPSLVGSLPFWIVFKFVMLPLTAPTSPIRQWLVASAVFLGQCLVLGSQGRCGYGI